MFDKDKMMIDKQAEIISSQNEKLAHLRKENERLAIKVYQLSFSAGFYDQLQLAIQQYPSLQSEWESFVALLRLTVPEAKDWTSKQDDTELKKLGFVP